MGFFTDKDGFIKIGAIIGTSIVSLAAVIILPASLTKVPVGSVGVQTNMSRVTGYTYSSGWYFKLPFVVSVEDMSIQEQLVELPETQGELIGKETINMTMNLTYSLNPDKAAEVYEKYGAYYIDRLMPQNEIFDIVKSVVAQYSIDEFNVKRRDIMTEARIELANRFSDRGITVNSLALANYSFDAALEAKIAEANAAAQAQKTQAINNQTALEAAENQKHIDELNAEKDANVKRTQAQADADAAKTRAEGEAEAIRIKAEAQAEANEELAASLTPQILEQQKLEKWNGTVPDTVLGNSSAVYVVD